MIKQVTFHLSAKRRGCHLVTSEVLGHLPKPLPQAGLLHLFVQHTSCALSINENADPDVRVDLNQIMNHVVKENDPITVIPWKVWTICRLMPSRCSAVLA